MSLGEDVFLAFVCSGRGLPKEDKHLRGRVLHVTAVKGAISRKDSLDNKLLAKFLVNNPSSQEMTKKKDKLVHKYNKFIILDSTRCKMIDDPGLALPHDPAPGTWQSAGWVYKSNVIRQWVREKLKGLP